MAAPLTVRTAGADGTDADTVRALAERASAEAGSPVLNEQSLIALSGATDTAPLVLIALAGQAGGEPVGAAVVELGPDASTVELVLPDGPAASAAGPALLDALLGQVTDERPVLLWAHGRGSRTTPLAEARGLPRTRELYVLARPGDRPVADAPLPPGVQLSSFRPGVDDAEWLAVNAEAFADHAEQGRWSAADLRARMDEPWFDPAGFLLARRADTGQLLGFHWTKTERAHPDGPIDSGEVYVIGVARAAAGLKLGSALLAAGLRHLAELGAPVVYLYVDGDNVGARALYANRGFVEHNLDVCFRLR
jgi:mycothiol synthase